MPAAEAFAYAVLQAIPRIERGERVNVGVVLFCRRMDFLGLRWELPAQRLLALDGDVDLDGLAAQLTALEQVAGADPRAGANALLPPSERFHWLVAPTSTAIAAGEVHTGLTDDPAETLSRLFERLVA
jgi:hypothetical protein